MVNLKRISQWLTLCCLLCALAKAEPLTVMRAGATTKAKIHVQFEARGWSPPAIAPRCGVWELEA